MARLGRAQPFKPLILPFRPEAVASSFKVSSVDDDWIWGAMKQNVASQIIGVQMVTASDGTAFTGAVSASVTIDGGVQGAGAGTVTHEGNGFHSYTITQAETNGAHIAVTFTGTGAVPRTVQAWTTFPQTGDNFVRLGAPAGASVSADVAAVKAETAAIVNDTDVIDDATSGLVKIATDVAAVLVDTGTTLDGRIPAALVSGRMDASVGAIAANAITAASMAADASAEIADAVWDEAQADHVAVGSFGITASEIADVLTDTGTTLDGRIPAALVGGRIDASVGAIAAAAITAASIAADAITDAKVAADVTIASVTGAVGSVTGNVSGSVASIATGGIAAASFAAGAIDAAAIAANAIGASEIAAGAIDAGAFAAGAIDAAAIAADALTDAKFDSTGKLRSHFTAVLKAIIGTGSTTTAVVLNATTGIDGGAPSATNDFYNGRVLVFTSGALAGQATSISDYVGATVTLTVVALTAGPAAADTAVIV